MQLEAFLQQQGVGYEKHAHTVAYTAQELATAEHVSGYMVAKPVVVKGSKGFVMCVVPAPRHVDLARVAKAMGEKHVRLATEEEMASLFPDCEVGAEPPVGKLYGLPTIMDTQLEQDEELVMQAGTHTLAIRMRRADWQKVCEPAVAPIAWTAPS